MHFLSLGNIYNAQIILNRVYKERLKEYSFKCKKKLESECLTLMEVYLNSRLQFLKSNPTAEYKQKFHENLKFYFDAHKVLSKYNPEYIHSAWTVTFDSDYQQSVFLKIKTLVVALIKTDDID